jgi:hypothetical protein
MAASAPDPETPLGIGIIVNRMAGQAIFAWNRPFSFATATSVTLTPRLDV